MRAAVGHSDEIDTIEAVEQVIDQCEAELEGQQPKAALLFASTTYDHQQALDAIADRWSSMPLIGGSTDGEMSSRGGFTRDSLLLVLLAGAEFEARVGLGRDLSAGPAAAVAAATQHLAAEAAVCLTTFAPSANSSDVVRRLQNAVGNRGCPIFGGLTADHREYTRMVEFCGREVLRDSLPALFLFGDVHAGWGLGSGWFPIGAAHRVTKSTGHIVHEIDGEPAISIFRHCWGEAPSASLGEYPLAVYPDGEDRPWVLRAPLWPDPVTGAIRFAGEVIEGAFVRVTEVLPEGLLSGATRSMETALRSFPGRRPELALLFSCAARRWVLGTKASEEFGQVRQLLDSGAAQHVKVAGFYCYGEIAPCEAGATSTFHNETCVSVLLG